MLHKVCGTTACESMTHRSRKVFDIVGGLNLPGPEGNH